MHSSKISSPFIVSLKNIYKLKENCVLSKYYLRQIDAYHFQASHINIFKDIRFSNQVYKSSLVLYIEKDNF